MNALLTPAALLLTALLGACAGPMAPRQGMVVDEKTGLMYGSAIQRNIVTDATFYNNRKIKVRTRNTSGDEVFSLSSFTGNLRTAYAAKGYDPTNEDDFGLLIDVNVMYSGQVQINQAASFTMIGALLGSTYGGQTDRGVITGTLSGATLGNIVGHYATEDTYMVIARVTFAVLKPYKESTKRITFSRSKKLKNIDDPNEDDKVYRRGFKNTFTTEIAVYAGGRNLKQSQIVEEVRKRAVRIIADFI